MKNNGQSREFGINESDRKLLLRIARESIGCAVRNESIPDFEFSSQSLQEKCGAFVTLEIESHLRGCIGNLESDRQLYRVVSEMAIASALRDPRFPPLTEEELDDVCIEISVLTPLRKIERIEEIEVGKHGLLVRRGVNSGLLLPQVAVRYNWDREEFLRETCRKAGLPQSAWKTPECELWIFSAFVFSEGEHA